MPTRSDDAHDEKHYRPATDPYVRRDEFELEA